MQYEFLTDEEQDAMLANRLRGYEQEHYNHVVNLTLLDASGATDQATKDAITQAENAIATLERAHQNAKAEREKVQQRIAARTNTDTPAPTPVDARPQP